MAKALPRSLERRGMPKEWKEARDARVAETERRMARGIYGQLPQQVFIIHQIKAPMLEAVKVLTSSESSIGNKFQAVKALRQVRANIQKLPRPTIENTWHPNSHRLIALRDEFFQQHKGLIFKHLEFAVPGVDFGIMMYDYDRPYRDMMDWVKVELDKQGLAHLAEVRDEFFQHCIGLAPQRLNFMRQVFNIGIRVYAHPSPLKDAMDWAWLRLQQLGWEPRGSMDLIGANWPWWHEEVKQP